MDFHQPSYSTYQKPMSNLFRINLKGKLRFNNKRPQEGALSIDKPIVKNFKGKPEHVIYLYTILSLLTVSQNIDALRQKDSQGL